MKHIFDEYYESHHQTNFNNEVLRCLGVDGREIGFFCVDCVPMIVNDFPWQKSILRAGHSRKIDKIIKERECYGS